MQLFSLHDHQSTVLYFSNKNKNVIFFQYKILWRILICLYTIYYCNKARMMILRYTEVTADV